MGHDVDAAGRADMTVDLASLEQKLRDRADQAGDAAAAEIVRRISANAPRDTGALAAGTTVERVDGMDWVAWTIRTVADSPEGFDYATAQEEGTGIYRPGGSPIVPVNAKVLRFYSKRLGQIVFRYSVAGTPPTWFFSHAIVDWPQVLAEAFGS